MTWVLVVIFAIVAVHLWISKNRERDNHDRTKSALSHCQWELENKQKVIDATKHEISESKTILESAISEKKQLEFDKNELSNQVRTLLDLLSSEKEKKKKLIDKITSGTFADDVTIFSIETNVADYTLFNYASNVSAIPFMAKLSSEFNTLDLKKLHDSLDWGSSVERAKKAASIRELRTETKKYLAQYKIYEYQLLYLLDLFPELTDILDTDYRSLPSALKISDIEHDAVRDYLSHEEYSSLSSAERNQLALNRYLNSHSKSNWQIGRDYENYIGYQFESRGYSVRYFGSLMGKADLGRDLIATKNELVYIVQCKYWSATKTIHEKHVAQLYGTIATYCIENNLSLDHDVTGVFVTNIDYSPTAKKFAEMLGIKLYSSVALGTYPMIKCNIGHGEFGATHIYHLPFDQQYDSVVIDRSKGERTVMTVREAESLGFRRAFKWHVE